MNEYLLFIPLFISEVIALILPRGAITIIKKQSICFLIYWPTEGLCGDKHAVLMNCAFTVHVTCGCWQMRKGGMLPQCIHGCACMVLTSRSEIALGMLHTTTSVMSELLYSDVSQILQCVWTHPEGEHRGPGWWDSSRYRKPRQTNGFYSNFHSATVSRSVLLQYSYCSWLKIFLITSGMNIVLVL